jgi:hypothetical protein
MKITDFFLPERHPFGMLDGYEHAWKKETTLAQLLRRCIIERNEDFVVETMLSHDDLVEDGLLERLGENIYRITDTALQLLSAYYGKGK